MYYGLLIKRDLIVFPLKLKLFRTLLSIDMGSAREGGVVLVFQQRGLLYWLSGILSQEKPYQKSPGWRKEGVMTGVSRLVPSIGSVLFTEVSLG